MLVVANLAITTWCKTPEKYENPRTWILSWEYSVRDIQWIQTWQGLYGFQNYLRPCALNEGSYSIGWVKTCICEPSITMTTMHDPNKNYLTNGCEVQLQFLHLLWRVLVNHWLWGVFCIQTLAMKCISDSDFGYDVHLRSKHGLTKHWIWCAFSIQKWP